MSDHWIPTGSYGLGVAAADFDNDGWPDIYVACDSVPSRFYHNKGDGTFEEIGREIGCAVNESGGMQGGMGVAVGDYDCDGWLDIVKTNYADQTANLYHNNGDGTFSMLSCRLVWESIRNILVGEWDCSISTTTGGPTYSFRVATYSPRWTPRSCISPSNSGKFSTVTWGMATLPMSPRRAVPFSMNPARAEERRLETSITTAMWTL